MSKFTQEGLNIRTDKGVIFEQHNNMNNPVSVDEMRKNARLLAASLRLVKVIENMLDVSGSDSYLKAEQQAYELLKEIND